MRLWPLGILLGACTPSGADAPSEVPAAREQPNPFADPVGYLDSISSVGDAPPGVAERPRVRWRIEVDTEAPTELLVLRGHGAVLSRFSGQAPLGHSVDPIGLGITTAPVEGTPIRDVADALADAIHQRIEQRRVVEEQDPARTWAIGEGDCTELADLLAASLRGLGVDSQVVGGVAAFEGELRYHAWTEYRDGDAWVGIDPTWDIFPLHAGYIPLDRAPFTDGLSRLESVITRTRISAID